MECWVSNSGYLVQNQHFTCCPFWPCQRHLSSELRGGIQFYRAPTPYQGADWKPGGWTLHRIGLDQCVVGLWMGSSTSCGPRVPMSS